MVYLAKMKYFCIGGELFFSAQAGDYVCALKQRLQEIQAAFSFEVLHLFGRSASLTNGLPREMAVREVDDSICSMKSGER